MYDDLNPTSTMATVQDRIARRVPERQPDVGMFAGFWGAVRDAAVAAPTEALRAVTAVSEAYGKAAEPQNRAALSVIDPETVRRADRNVEQDVQAPLRRTIERFTPDPAVTGTASQIVYGALKVLGKAGGYGAAGGLPGAVAGTGLDEGINEALRLTDKGVALPTAAKVGAVHGVATALSIVAPVAGRTALQTTGLVLTTGPGFYMAENAAARRILEAEDYAAIAQEYDPFNPVGLVASLVPGAVIGTGAHAMRARKAARVNPAEVAAARTLVDAEQVNGATLSAPADVAGVNAHVDALDATAQALDAGGRVSVAQTVSVDPARLAAVAKRVQDVMTPEAVAAARAAAAELDVASGRVNQAEAMALGPDPIPTGYVPEGFDPETGAPLGRSIDEIHAEAELDINDARAFQVAAECFLRHG